MWVIYLRKLSSFMKKLLNIIICFGEKVGVIGVFVFVMGCVMCFFVIVSLGVVIGMGFLS